MGVPKVVFWGFWLNVGCCIHYLVLWVKSFVHLFSPKAFFCSFTGESAAATICGFLQAVCVLHNVKQERPNYLYRM